MTENAARNFVEHPLTRYRASQHDVTRRSLESELWERRFQGVHSWHQRDPTSPRVRIADVATLLPEGATVGGWAAAHLRGADDLDGFAADGITPLPITICLQPDMQMRGRSGIVHLRSAFSDSEVEIIDGVPVLTAVRTCFDLARRSPDLTEAVVGIDAMLRSDLVTLDELRDYVAEHRRWRGRPRAARAAQLADGRARSCQESRFRVLWVVDAGLPRPLVNAPIYSASHHAPLGEADLLDVTTALVGEYDGSTHRGIEQHTADNAREESLEHHGLVVVRATHLDLTRHRRRLVHRLRLGYERGLARDRGSDRWTIDRSPFTQ